MTLGINESALYSFQAGRTAPGLRRAVRIQNATDHFVPVESWVEPPIARARAA